MPVEVIAEETVVRGRVQLDHVNARTAVETVVALLALEPVGICSTPQDVVAAAAEELVLAGAAEDLVVTTERVGVRVDRVSARVEPVTRDELRAAVAEDHLTANAAVNPVRARATVHLTATQQRLRLQLRLGRGPGRVRVAVEEVHAVPAPHPLAGKRLRVAVTKQPVAAGPAIQLVLAGGAGEAAVEVEVAT